MSDGEGVESLGRPGIGDMGGRQWKERTRKRRQDKLTYSLGLSCNVLHDARLNAMCCNINASRLNCYHIIVNHSMELLPLSSYCW